MARDVSGVKDPASAWLMRFAGLIPVGARVLELAAGNGRNTRFMTLMGWKVTAVDVNVPPAFFPHAVEFRELDLEGADWPLAGEAFDAVIGINYLYRPHWEALWDNLAAGGVFLYETFTRGQLARFGKPRNPDHWLKEGELLTLCLGRGRIIAYEEGRTDADASFARIAVRKAGAGPDEDRLFTSR